MKGKVIICFDTAEDSKENFYNLISAVSLNKIYSLNVPIQKFILMILKNGSVAFSFYTPSRCIASLSTSDVKLFLEMHNTLGMDLETFVSSFKNL